MFRVIVLASQVAEARSVANSFLLGSIVRQTSGSCLSIARNRLGQFYKADVVVDAASLLREVGMALDPFRRRQSSAAQVTLRIKIQIKAVSLSREK